MRKTRLLLVGLLALLAATSLGMVRAHVAHACTYWNNPYEGTCGNLQRAKMYDDGSADLRAGRLTIIRSFASWDVSDGQEAFDGLYIEPGGLGTPPIFAAGYDKGGSLTTNCTGSDSIAVKYTTIWNTTGSVGDCLKDSSISASEDHLVGISRCSGSAWCSLMDSGNIVLVTPAGAPSTVQREHVGETFWCDELNVDCYHGVSTSGYSRATHGWSSGSGDTNWQVSPNGEATGGGWFVVPSTSASTGEYKYCFDSAADFTKQSYSTTTTWDIFFNQAGAC